LGNNRERFKMTVYVCLKGQNSRSYEIGS